MSTETWAPSRPMSMVMAPRCACQAVSLIDLSAALLPSIFTVPFPSEVTSLPLGQLAVNLGGVAARAYRPADLADLQQFVARLPLQEPVCMVGLGSNLLVRDGGYRGTIVLMHRTRGELRLDAGLLYADAGLAAPKVARFAARQDIAEDRARHEVERRSAAQRPDQEKARAADFVIDNSGPLADTERQVEAVFAELKRLAAENRR